MHMHNFHIELYEHGNWVLLDVIHTGAIAAKGRLFNDDTPVHISAVNCTGLETTLYSCSLTFTLEDTQSCAVDQGVACQGEACVCM